MDETDGVGFSSAPCRKWSWWSVAAEASKIPVGMTYGLLAVADALHSCISGVHGDVVAHWNYRAYQQVFAEEVMLDLEQLPEA